jgi:SAM-dependent methyltransferase
MEILRYFTESTENLNKFEFEFESNTTGQRPAWIWIKKDENTKPRFIQIRTESDSGIVYKRFNDNFYYPIDQTEAEEIRFYAKYSEFYDKYTEKNNIPMANQLLSKFAKYKINKDSKILDLGSGTGIFSNLAAENGFHNLTLFDRSSEMLNVAKAKANLSKSEFITGDINSYKVKRSFDVIASVMLFDNLNDEQLETVTPLLLKSLNSKGFIFIVEDKKRDAYYNNFEVLEDGVFTISEKRNFAKYYFIGRKK